MALTFASFLIFSPSIDVILLLKSLVLMYLIRLTLQVRNHYRHSLPRSLHTGWNISQSFQKLLRLVCTTPISRPQKSCGRLYKSLLTMSLYLNSLHSSANVMELLVYCSILYIMRIHHKLTSVMLPPCPHSHPKNNCKTTWIESLFPKLGLNPYSLNNPSRQS